MCGREITNPDANYCDYCGTAVGAFAVREERVEPRMTEAPKEERVSSWLLLGVLCLQFVPFIGSFAQLGILLDWALASNIKDSRKSFARAFLVYSVILVVITLAVLVPLLVLGGTVETMSGMDIFYQ